MGEGSKGWMRNSHSVIKFFSSHLLVQSGSMSRCLACLLPLGWYICSCSRPTDKYTNEWRKCLFFLHTNGIHLATLESSTHNISFWEHPKMINYASASSSSCWWWWWRPLRIDDLRMNSRRSAPHTVSMADRLRLAGEGDAALARLAFNIWQLSKPCIWQDILNETLALVLPLSNLGAVHNHILCYQNHPPWPFPQLRGEHAVSFSDQNQATL